MHSSDSVSPPPGCPAHQAGGPGQKDDFRTPLYGAEFAADPGAFYAYLRHYGVAAPVELAPGVPATLVTDYSAALHVLQNSELFSKDSRRWRDFTEGRVPADSPVVPMMAYRPNALFSDGAPHLRLRQAITDSMSRIDTHRLSRQVERVSTYLVDQFSARGSADLINDYAKLLSLLVFNDIFGCPEEIGDRLVEGFSNLFDGIDTENANQEVVGALSELVAHKRAKPGSDVTTWLMEHPSNLTDEEMVHQLVTLIAGGSEPMRNLMATCMLLILSDARFFGGQYGGALLVEDAIDEVLWNSPPFANYGIHYPTQDVDLFGVKLAAGDPVVVSFAAANTDPALSSSRQTLSKRAHLAWSAGPHACPAKDPAQLIAIAAIEKLLNELPDVELAVAVDSLTWRPGPFHRALATLPVRFSPVRKARPQPSAPQPQQSAADQDRAKKREKAGRGGLWSSFLSWWRE
ncbi:cytochrome P450 [Streptomyces radicis]|uniref:Cytochrome P450 n=1 Tax=Streptomyces radicis TaxID=1750517 RepID=A0A3A9WS33_9ACTN|nr:cytochrome P450 [Streptomyces radicis]RKN10596.1 cytochrome P450 [Streptomyces radicis]RKN24856.1 cytochrome P450 [Streptomyces radicis]